MNVLNFASMKALIERPRKANKWDTEAEKMISLLFKHLEENPTQGAVLYKDDLNASEKTALHVALKSHTRVKGKYSRKADDVANPNKEVCILVASRQNGGTKENPLYRIVLAHAPVPTTAEEAPTTSENATTDEAPPTPEPNDEAPQTAPANA